MAAQLSGYSTMLTCHDPISFTDTVVDTLRLPDEARVLTFAYISKYNRFIDQKSVRIPIDQYTLSLASIHLTTLTLSLPRRLSSLLAPAWRLLHPGSPPLSIPSETYSSLRKTLIRSLHHLLRALSYRAHISTPMAYIPRYLSRTLSSITSTTDDFDDWLEDEKFICGVEDGMNTALGRTCVEECLRIVKKEGMMDLFPARVVALGAVYVSLRRRGINLADEDEKSGLREWIRDIASGKVELEDFQELIGKMRKTEG